MPAYTSVTAELAAKYPALAGKVGKTITSAELASARNSAKGKPASANIVLPPPPKGKRGAKAPARAVRVAKKRR